MNVKFEGIEHLKSLFLHFAIPVPGFVFCHMQHKLHQLERSPSFTLELSLLQP